MKKYIKPRIGKKKAKSFFLRHDYNRELSMLLTQASNCDCYHGNESSCNLCCYW